MSSLILVKETVMIDVSFRPFNHPLNSLGTGIENRESGTNLEVGKTEAVPSRAHRTAFTVAMLKPFRLFGNFWGFLLFSIGEIP